ncbi:hypothetical protein LTR37_001815 [Vermiconidia calcicola]|uniref:Uncharacterized protein n=1 Tax=Vermiconidia calcicola TaxID=1690605 RepID=A0ACC3NVA7_9PEZI|nr:hypothetical protein LTR37_001815 [Vermiconidia calcicola]
MAGLSRMDRLVNMLGGEQNLPPKLPQPTTSTEPEQTDEVAAEEQTTQEDPINKLQSMDSYLQENQNSENWWDAVPQIPQPKQPSGTTQARPAQPYSSDGSLHFIFDSEQGRPAPLGMSFAPFVAVTRFCYKFVSKELQQPLATAFFDEGKIWNREWDLYYIWSDYFQTAKPVIFITEYQLQALITKINNYFPQANIKLTDELREEGLAISFDEFDSVDLRPRFLGHSTSRDQIDYWTTHLPLPTSGEGAMPDQRAAEAFRAKMELSQEISKAKSKAAKKKKQADTVLKRQDMVRMLTRAQRYLGMVVKKEDSLMPDISSLAVSAVSVDVSEAAPYAFDSDIIFIAVDAEAFEEGRHQVTEVGIATLDTRDLINQPPGTNGQDWQECISARHFRITEYKNLTNNKYVEGCPDKFEFGKSDFVGKDKIAQKVASCFKPPYGVKYPSLSDDMQAEEKRNLVLVGHDLSQDVNYLKQIGFNVANCGNIIDTVDTAALFRIYTKDPTARSLGSILYDFEFTGWNLHNAGNDAVYTLWAMLAICVKDASESGSAEAAEKQEETIEKRKALAAEQAKERVLYEAEGWESTGDDGGEPVRPAPPAVMYGPPRPKKENRQGMEKRQYYTPKEAVLDV